jgi:hypothetical protein
MPSIWFLFDDNFERLLQSVRGAKHENIINEKAIFNELACAGCRVKWSMLTEERKIFQFSREFFVQASIVGGVVAVTNSDVEKLSVDGFYGVVS